MTDVLSPLQRAACMTAVRSKDTSPEMLVRRTAHALGYRYALHVARLPGRPDLVFTSRRKIIFVHGCFWHNHNCPRGSRRPATHPDYWQAKRERNARRDSVNTRQLRKQGWSVMTIWECRMKDRIALARRIRRFLES